MKKRYLIIATLVILILFLGYKLDIYAEDKLREQNTNITSASALLDILGELRYTAAAVLWLKTDFYQHEYEGKDLNARTNEPIMPLIRLVTLLDPHFVQAYDYGAYHLSVNLGKPKEGEEFLLEGLRYNPDSFDLNWEAGFINYLRKDYAKSLPFLLKARKLRNQKTPVYDDYIKTVWVNTRIADIYKHMGKPKEAEFFRKEMLEFIKANNYDTQHSKTDAGIEEPCSCGHHH